MSDTVLFASYQISKDVPDTLEYVPGGVHTITATVNDKPATRKIEIQPEDAAVLDAQLQALLKAAEEGKASRPYIDFDHEGGSAAAIPKRFFWEDGLRLEVEWTKAGREAIEGRVYSYFSPTMLISKDGRIVGLPEFGPIGALVNTPAFQTIERIAARYSSNHDTPTTMSDANEQLLKERNQQIEKQASEIESLKAANAELQKKNEELVSAKSEVETERDTLKASKEELEAKVEATRKEKIEARVDTLVKAGRILEKSKDDIVKTALKQEDDGETLFAALPEVKAPKGHPPIGENNHQNNNQDDQKTLSGIDRLEASISKSLKKGTN